MTTPKYRLPHRKWYTLPQAIKQIHKLTGEQLEIDDLIHFWAFRLLDISVFIQCHNQEYYFHKFSDGSVEFSPNIYQGRIKIGDLSIDNDEKVLFYPSSFLMTKNNLTYKSDLLEISSFLQGNFANLYIDGFFSIYPMGESPYRLEKDNKEKIRLYYANLFFSKENVNGEDVFFNLDLEQESEELALSFDDLVILHNDLNDFLIGKQARTINITQHTPKGRPKNSLKQIILGIAKETFKANPNQSRNKIATAVLEHLEKHYFQEYPVINLRTIDNYLKEEDIGNPKARNKAKPIIKDPFKDS